MTDSPKHVTVRLRVPPELRDKINASSEQYNRSMNADMVARLEQSFVENPSQKFGDPDFRAKLEHTLSTISESLERLEGVEIRKKHTVMKPILPNKKPTD